MTVNLSQEDKHVARIHTVETVFALVNKQTNNDNMFFVVIDAIVFALVNKHTNKKQEHAFSSSLTLFRHLLARISKMKKRSHQF